MKCLALPCALSDAAVSHKVTANKVFPGITSARVAAETDSTNLTQIQSEQRFKKKKTLSRLYACFVPLCSKNRVINFKNSVHLQPLLLVQK
jgi:peroxiredoxin